MKQTFLATSTLSSDHREIGSLKERKFMYVCICKAITEEKLKTQVENGASSFDQVQQRCGAASACGSCRLNVERLIRQTVAAGEDAKANEPQRASG